MKKIGLFGGAFDPVHIGHIDLAKVVLSEYNLDEVIFIPSKTPPHKQPHLASAIDRLNMMQIAIKKLENNFSVSDVEIKSNETSYTYNTVKKFLNDTTEIYFICGSDIFATIETWHKWKELLNLVKFIVVERANFSFNKMLSTIDVNLDEKIEKRSIILLKKNIIDISSSILRKNLDKSYLDEDVYKYIKSNKLYEGI